MSIVRQVCKKTGTIYVYESDSYWNKEKKQSRAKRKLIGKLDPETNEVIPTKKKAIKSEEVKEVKRGRVPVTEAARSFYGATYLFDSIGDKINLTEQLKKCFPDTYRQILSLAYYLILEDKNPLSRFSKWSYLHKHPYGKDIASQRSSELFASITEKDRERFFRLWGKQRVEKEYWAYDTTSISSYSKCLKQVKYGFNKDYDPLPQINLALLYGEKSNLPFYYRKLAGNIPDVKTITNLLADMESLGFFKVKLVMDKGFYSESNINELYKNHRKFLISTRTSLKYVKTEIDKVRDSIRNWSNYSQEYDLYRTSVSITWAYSQNRPNKKDTIKDEKRLYLHIYFSAEKAVEEEKKLNIMLGNLQRELESGSKIAEHENLYNKYFDISNTPARGTKAIAKNDVIEEARRNHGYFTLISNDLKDPIEALEIYRNKDLIEKAFGNVKDRLNLRRTLVSSEQSLDGKLFVEFIALIYLSYIKKQMQEKEMFKKYTLQEVLDELDVIECFEQTGKTIRVGEMTKNQTTLYYDLGVDPPTSL